MDLIPPSFQDEFLADLRAAEAATRTGVTSQYQHKKDRHFQMWADFCHDLHVDPYLRECQDPITLLQVYAVRVRDGRLAPSGNPVQSSTVATAVRSVGQACALMGHSDPRLTKHGDIDLRLRYQFRSYQRADPPPERLLPIAVPIIKHAVDSLHLNPGATELDRAVADMICLGFFFLLRPGEYCYTSYPESSPFVYSNVTFYRGNVQLSATAPSHEIMTAISVTLTFSIQKNMVRGERVGQSTSGNQHFCPVRAAGRRFLHLREQQGPYNYSATPDTPLYTFYPKPRQSAKVSTNAMRQALRTSASQLDPLADTSKIFTRALRTSGAMALVLARVDSSLIRLLGHWKSDAMLNYLKVEYLGVLHRYAQTMAQLSNFDTNYHY